MKKRAKTKFEPSAVDTPVGRLPSFSSGKEQRSPGGRRYFVKPDHRMIPTEDKSVWIVGIQDEIRCFDHALDAGWLQESVAWGLHFSLSTPAVLGKNLLYEVKIAKFLSDPPMGLWHGYPADYLRMAQDRPPTGVLVAWRESSIIQKHEVSKVRQGKPCSLSD